MSSIVEICNMALSNIRAGSINSLTESSLQAQVCDLKYETVRNMLLRENVWGFARKVTGLALTVTELYNWTYAYQYPSDCLKVNRLVPKDESLTYTEEVALSLSEQLKLRNKNRQVKYEVLNYSGNKLIAANEADLYIDYVVKVTDPNLYDETFILALSHLLASEIAIPIVGVESGRQLRDDSLKMYEEYLASATASDMNEGYDGEDLSELETVRQ